MRISFRLNSGDIRLERGGVKKTGYGVGMDLVVRAYAVTKSFPREEMYGALGSLAEAETQLEIARRLRMASDDELEVVTALAIRARQLLLGLRRSLAPRT